MFLYIKFYHRIFIENENMFLLVWSNPGDESYYIFFFNLENKLAYKKIEKMYALPLNLYQFVL